MVGHVVAVATDLVVGGGVDWDIGARGRAIGTVDRAGPVWVMCVCVGVVGGGAVCMVVGLLEVVEDVVGLGCCFVAAQQWMHDV